MAYGHLNLTPDEFFKLTPRQFSLMYKGWQQREERTGRYVQWLLSAHLGKDTPDINDITGFSTEEATGEESTPKRVERAEQDKVLGELSVLLR